MDFDSIISMLFILLFFLLPSLLRQLRQKALKKASPDKKKAKKKKNTIFTRIGDQIQKILREIEEQQRQQQEAAKQAAQQDPDDFWQELGGEEGIVYEEERRAGPEQEIPVPAAEAEPAPLSGPALAEMTEIGITDGFAPSFEEKQIPMKSRYRKNQLQNAVVWAEILGKPVALKK
ncbi:MAG: hypothetical protein MI862_24165 [Desulfobacterales bacterium]|nr:hypothetical protein [Desulfobacterales bacterium]